MGNPQGKTNEMNIAWLAGFLDGEGCFDLQRAYATKLRRIESWRPRIRISNTDIPTLDTVTAILDPLDVGYHVCWRIPNSTKWAKSWTVEVVGLRKGLKFLQIIAPYLKTKRVQAEKLMTFARSRLACLPRNGHAPYTEDEVHLISLIRSRAA